MKFWFSKAVNSTNQISFSIFFLRIEISPKLLLSNLKLLMKKFYTSITSKDVSKDSPYYKIIKKEEDKEKAKWRDVKIFLWFLYQFIRVFAFLFKFKNKLKDILFIEIKLPTKK